MKNNKNLLKSFITNITADLAKGLPGKDSQFKMAPITRAKEMARINHQISPKECGVLILFYERNEDIYTVFMKRTSYDGVHSSQVSFPGGKYENSDHSLIETAFREANEEIGIDLKSVKLIGELSDLYIPPSNFNVLPVMAWTENVPVFKIDKNEVERLIEVPLSTLINPDSIKNKHIKTRFGERVGVPCYFIENEIIWGATAMIISELNDLIYRSNPAI